MNAAESARVVAVKSGRCLACLQLLDQGRITYVPEGCDYHHLLSGGRRRGHLFGIGLCAWHHRQVPDWGCTVPEMREVFGPSLMCGSKTFHAAFGSDAELLAKQDELLGELA